jgi:hypothetical protein
VCSLFSTQQICVELFACLLQGTFDHVACLLQGAFDHVASLLQGTFGTVFKAWDNKWDEYVAIKVVSMSTCCCIHGRNMQERVVSPHEYIVCDIRTHSG